LIKKNDDTGAALPLFNPSHLKDSVLSQLYDQLWNGTLASVKRSGFEHDALIDSPSDWRHGLTLLIRPSEEVKQAVQLLLDELKAIEPEHYYYPKADIHVTVMTIISCYEGFRLEQVDVDDYVTLLQDCLTGLPPFTIKFQGITASPSAIMIQGFPTDHTLEHIRNRLRRGFKHSFLEQSLDKRYPLRTAHATVVRFKKTVVQQEFLVNKLLQFREMYFGEFEVGELEFVFNDWYQRKDKVKTLYRFRLGVG